MSSWSYNTSHVSSSFLIVALTNVTKILNIPIHHDECVFWSFQIFNHLNKMI